ncbi:nucleoside hydrolase-like domain-containing protein [Actinomadura sp. NPDC000600]|uniref:nucleoside hydrolase-like domain-containing protein n=1 Tax=Actinomadura sp. NPDC000600 TaxID=3154262 RepID=UPI0033974F6E
MLSTRHRPFAVLCTAVATVMLLLLQGIGAVEAAASTDGWARIEAESYTGSGGSLQTCNGVLCYVGANAWVQYNGVDLHTGTDTVQLNAANGGGDTKVQVWIGGTNTATLTIGGTGGWDTYQTKSLTLPPQNGVQDVKLVFVNGNLNLDWLTFSGTSTPPHNDGTVFAVNAGGNAYTASDGTTFTADTGFTGGTTYTTTNPIAATTDDPLYQTERYGNFTYKATVPNAAYLVTLYFAETYHTQTGKRSFDVQMEGTERITDLDIYAKAGANTAYTTQTPVTVTDGALDLKFISNVENAKVNAIKVITAGPAEDPVAAFTVSPERPKPGETVTVDASGSFDPNGTITAYKIDFGDGATANTATATHKYTGEGGYTVTVTVTDNDGRTSTAKKTISVSQKQKYRIVVSSDFPTLDGANSDPDDVQSMVRFLMYSNEFDIEGMLATAATTRNVANKQNMLAAIDKYALVYQNLKKHDPDYPSPDYLRSIVHQGRNGTWGGSTGNNIGAGKDSDASDAVISIVDKADSRPVWFSIWGDNSQVAQAIWKVKNTRSQAELDRFLSKMRIFAIAHQDDTIDWMKQNFPNLFIIHSNTTYGGMFCNSGDTSLCNLAWLDANIRNNHGPLGAVYPPRGCCITGVQEGDSPSFLHLLSANRGINNPEDPTQPSWGGQYKRDGSTNHWVDGPGGGTISRWRADFQSSFAERADWNLP